MTGWFCGWKFIRQCLSSSPYSLYRAKHIPDAIHILDLRFSHDICRIGSPTKWWCGDSGQYSLAKMTEYNICLPSSPSILALIKKKNFVHPRSDSSRMKYLSPAVLWDPKLPNFGNYYLMLLGHDRTMSQSPSSPHICVEPITKCVDSYKRVVRWELNA